MLVTGLVRRTLVALPMVLAGCNLSSVIRGDAGLSGADAGRFTQVATAPLFACALRDDGEAVCWGYKQSGVLEPPPGPFTQIATSEYGVCALRRDHGVTCWGRNFSSGRKLVGPEGSYVAVSGGRTGFCGLRDDGGIWCWGDAEFGFFPSEVAYQSVHLSHENVCVLREDRRVDCVGADVPGPWTPPAEPLTSIDVGWAIACGVREDGSAVCWGLGEAEAAYEARTPLGDLDQNGTRELETLSMVSAARAAQRQRLAAENTGNMADAAVAKGTAIGATLVAAGVPKALAISAIRKGGVLERLPEGELVRISVGALGEVCGLDREGTPICTGSLDPDAGDGGPPMVPPPGHYVDLDTASVYACAVRDDGRLACWGVDYKGRSAPPGSPASG